MIYPVILQSHDFAHTHGIDCIVRGTSNFGGIPKIWKKPPIGKGHYLFSCSLNCSASKNQMFTYLEWYY